MSQLSSGAATLKTGSAQVVDGIAQLDSGAQKMADSLEEYKSEGIDTLTDTVNEYLDEFEDIQNALGDLDADSLSYTNYSGIADDMDGSVRFIIATDAITADDE